MKSALMREAPAALRFILNVISRSPEQAASKVAYLAFSSDVVGVSGGFFIGNKARQPAAYALNAENQDRLWQEGAEMTRCATRFLFFASPCSTLGLGEITA